MEQKMIMISGRCHLSTRFICVVSVAILVGIVDLQPGYVLVNSLPPLTPNLGTYEILGNRIEYAQSLVYGFDDGDVSQSISVVSPQSATHTVTVAIGAPDTIELAEVPGQVFVYQNRNVTLSSSSSAAVQQNWEQKGQTTTGRNTYEGYGHSVVMSKDGNTMVVGSFNPSFSHIEKRVSVYRYNNTINKSNNTWEKIGSDILFNDPNLQFGGQVDISSDGTIIAFDLLTRKNDSYLIANNYIRVLKYDESLMEWKQMGNDIHPTFEIPTSNVTLPPDLEIDFLEQHVTSPFSMSDDGSTIALGISRLIWYKNIYYEGCYARRQYYNVVRAYKIKNNNVSPMSQPTWDQVGSDVDDNLFHAMSGDGTRIFVYSSVSAIEPPGRVYQLVDTSSLSSSLKWVQVGDDLHDDVVGATMSSDGTIIAICLNEFLYRRFTFEMIINVYQLANDSASSQNWYLVDTIRPKTTIRLPLKVRLSMSMSSDGTIIAIGDHNKVTQMNYVDIYQFVPSSTVPVATPTAAPIDTPTNIPTMKPIMACTTDDDTIGAAYSLFNSRTDQMVAPLTNGTIIRNPSPVNRTNIEAVLLDCNGNTIGAPTTTTTNNNKTVVEIQLYDSNTNQLIHRRMERYAPYFLFGDNPQQQNIYNGRIVSGTYHIRVIVNRTRISPFMTFSLLEPSSY